MNHIEALTIITKPLIDIKPKHIRILVDDNSELEIILFNRIKLYGTIKAIYHNRFKIDIHSHPLRLSVLSSNVTIYYDQVS